MCPPSDEFVALDADCSGALSREEVRMMNSESLTDLFIERGEGGEAWEGSSVILGLGLDLVCWHVLPK